MERLPLISVIVPVYNIREYLPRCVRSITGQTYENLEILLVDDGSDDGSGQMCEELAAEDCRIRVFHKDNGGSSSARNMGIAHARGEYLGFVDSDDYIEPGMYQLLLEAVLSYGVRAAQAGRDEIEESGRRLANICEPPEEPTLYSCKAFLNELIMHRGDCSFCTKLLHREVLRNSGEQVLHGKQVFHGFPEGTLNEDFHLLVKLLPEIGDIVSLPEQMYHVFYRMGSNTRKADKEAFSRVFGDNVDNADMVMEMVRRDYPDLIPVALRFGVFQRLEYLLHIPVGKMEKENKQYRAIVRWLRRSWLKGMGNPYLTVKDKLYHTLFTIMPKGIRVIHKKLRGI